MFIIQDEPPETPDAPARLRASVERGGHPSGIMNVWPFTLHGQTARRVAPRASRPFVIPDRFDSRHPMAA